MSAKRDESDFDFQVEDMASASDGAELRIEHGRIVTTPPPDDSSSQAWADGRALGGAVLHSSSPPVGGMRHMRVRGATHER